MQPSKIQVDFLVFSCYRVNVSSSSLKISVKEFCFKFLNAATSSCSKKKFGRETNFLENFVYVRQFSKIVFCLLNFCNVWFWCCYLYILLHLNWSTECVFFCTFQMQHKAAWNYLSETKQFCFICLKYTSPFSVEWNAVLWRKLLRTVEVTKIATS